MKRAAWFFLPMLSLAIALAGCAPVQAGPNPSPSNSIPTASGQSMPSPTLVSEAMPTETGQPPTLQGRLIASFGDPIAIGRGSIRDAAFSPDRATLAIGWTNGVSLVRVSDQQEFWYRQTPQMLIALDISNQYIAALLVTGDVWLFDVQNGESRVFAGAALADDYWGDVAWSPDGGLAAIQTIGGAGDGATPVLILDPAADEIRELPGSLTDAGWQPLLRWSPDGRMIAAADQDGRAWVLDAVTGAVVYRVPDTYRDYRLRILGWLPDSKSVVYGAMPGFGLRLVDVTTGEQVLQLQGASPGEAPSQPVVFAPHSGLALVGAPGTGGEAIGGYEIQPYEVWDLAAGKPLGVPPVGERRHINSAVCTGLARPAVAFDGQEVLYLDTDGQLIRWQVGAAAGETLGQLAVRSPCLVTPMVWSPDSTRLALETDPGRAVTAWDVATGQLLAERRDGTYPADIHGSLLAYRGADGQLIVWDLEGKAVRYSLPGPVTPFTGGVAFSPDGGLVAYGAGHGLQIADVASGQLLASLDAYPPNQQVSHIRWAPGGDALAVAGGVGGDTIEQAGSLILWERQGNAFREVFRTQTVHANYDVDWADPARFNPSGELVALEQLPALEAGQQAVLVYDRQQGKVIGTKQDYVIQQWLSDDVLLVTEAGGWGTFMEWPVRTKEAQAVRRGGGDAALGSYAPDGIHHADVLQDRLPPRWIVIRDWRSGEAEVTAYLGSDGQDVRFSPDGCWLVARGGDGLVKVFPVIYSSPTGFIPAGWH